MTWANHPEKLTPSCFAIRSENP